MAEKFLMNSAIPVRREKCNNNSKFSMLSFESSQLKITLRLKSQKFRFVMNFFAALCKSYDTTTRFQEKLLGARIE